MSREWQLYWRDILHCCKKVLRYVGGLTREQFEADERTYDAVLRNLEIIGEAVKHLPDEARSRAPNIEWRNIAGFRDVVAHAYFGIDNEIVWDIVTNKVPEILREIEAIDLNM